MTRFIAPTKPYQKPPNEIRLYTILDSGQRVEMHSRAGQRRCKGMALGLEYAADKDSTRWIAVLWDDDPQPEWVDAGEITKAAKGVES